MRATDGELPIIRSVPDDYNSASPKLVHMTTTAKYLGHYRGTVKDVSSSQTGSDTPSSSTYEDDFPITWCKRLPVSKVPMAPVSKVDKNGGFSFDNVIPSNSNEVSVVTSPRRAYRGTTTKPVEEASVSSLFNGSPFGEPGRPSCRSANSGPIVVSNPHYVCPPIPTVARSVQKASTSSLFNSSSFGETGRPSYRSQYLGPINVSNPAYTCPPIPTVACDVKKASASSLFNSSPFGETGRPSCRSSNLGPIVVSGAWHQEIPTLACNIKKASASSLFNSSPFGETRRPSCRSPYLGPIVVSGAPSTHYQLAMPTSVSPNTPDETTSRLGIHDSLDKKDIKSPSQDGDKIAGESCVTSHREAKEETLEPTYDKDVDLTDENLVETPGEDSHSSAAPLPGPRSRGKKRFKTIPWLSSSRNRPTL